MTAPTLRRATPKDGCEIAALVNLAYRVEDFFKIGDRTDETHVLASMGAGSFLLLTGESGAVVGAIHVEVRAERGHFGMLSVHPACQARGLGRRLITEAERHCRSAGCQWMDLEVVNLREELPAVYRTFGYRVVGTAPFPAMERTKLPCHFIVMSKQLVAEGDEAKEAAR